MLAQYVYAKIFVPVRVVERDELLRRGFRSIENSPESVTFSLNNKKQDRGPMGNPLSDIRFEPILPELNIFLGSCRLNLDALLTGNQDLEISWQVHADNAPPSKATRRLGDIPVNDKRHN